MKFSVNYILYPDNRVLERAIASTISLLGKDQLNDAAATPDTGITVADNFLHTRGNYEQRRFSTNILDALRAALEASLTDEFRAEKPLTWAEAQDNLGNILAAQAQQQRDAGLYEKAIQCFNHALEQYSQEKSPLEWAATLYNLGTVRQAFGRQLDDTKSLKASIDDYTNALLVWSRTDTPEEWALAMHQLGATFHAYGKLLKGNRTFQKSVVAYKNALAVFDADNYPLELTATHNNRGAVLQHLGESEENAGRLEEAIKSYEKALAVSMEQQLPFHLAVICRVNKATAQNVLAEMTKDVSLAEEVADEFELIIECFPHALQPLCLKHCEEQLNRAKSLALANSA
jgi:tetratricopeptide (TPR) repeat protein